MNKIPINEEKIPTYTKKALKIIIALVFAGILTGLVLSNIFTNEANDRILHFNDEMPPPHGDGGFLNFTIRVEPLTTSEIILPTLGVIIVCISTFLLIGLIAVYIKIFVKTKSKYIGGLLFFLVPLLFQSIFSVNTVRSLFVSSAIPYGRIRESIGFGFGGLGGILVIVSVFEIIGLTILLYLSTE
jgi:hypothetical protein